jgi:predicted acyl esterase
MAFVTLFAELPQRGRTFLCEGMLALPPPECPTRLRVRLRPAGILLPAGTRLAVTVATQNFPRYAARPISALTDRIGWAQGEAAPRLDLSRASVRLRLPLIPLEDAYA